MAPTGRRAPLAGPTNNVLILGVLALVALILGLVGYAVYAVSAPVKEPRTAVERQVMMLANEVRAKPQNKIAWVDYIRALIAAEQYSKAVEVADQAVRVIADKAGVVAMKAEALHRQGRDDAAMSTAAEAIKIDAAYRKKVAGDLAEKGVDAPFGPSEAVIDAELVRADIYLDRGAVGKAITSYTAALGQRSTMSDVLVMRGEAYLRAGDLTKAAADFAEALRYDPTSLDAKAGLEKAKGGEK